MSDLNVPRPATGKWTIMDVIERLVDAGKDAHLFVRLTINGKNYDLRLADVEVTDLRSMPSHVTFFAEPVRPDTPIKVNEEKPDGSR